MKPARLALACLGLALLALFCWAKSCRSDAALRQAKVEYAGRLAVAEAENEMSRRTIGELSTRMDTLAKESATKDKQISQYVEKASTLKAELAKSDSEAMALRTKVQPVLDSNPAMAEFVAALDAGIVLRDKLIVNQDSQITALKERVRLADLRYESQAKISEEWQAMYEREASLRKQAEGLFKMAERRTKSSRFITKAAVVVAGAVVVSRLIK